jgi:hypothetical protein
MPRKNSLVNVFRFIASSSRFVSTQESDGKFDFVSYPVMGWGGSNFWSAAARRRFASLSIAQATARGGQSGDKSQHSKDPTHNVGYVSR